MAAPSLAEIVLDKSLYISELIKGFFMSTPEQQAVIIGEVFAANTEMLMMARRRATASEADRRLRAQQSAALAVRASVPPSRG